MFQSFRAAVFFRLMLPVGSGYVAPSLVKAAVDLRLQEVVTPSILGFPASSSYPFSFPSCRPSFPAHYAQQRKLEALRLQKLADARHRKPFIVLGALNPKLETLNSSFHFLFHSPNIYIYIYICIFFIPVIWSFTKFDMSWTLCWALGLLSLRMLARS